MGLSTMDKILVSVCISVFNGEGYLRKCLDSIASKDICDMEIILVDDGSTDHSLQIMQQYREEYPELRRRVTKMEYNSVVRRAAELGLNGFTQEKSSASEKYVPDFDLKGIE